MTSPDANLARARTLARSMLEDSQSFGQLHPEKRAQLARGLVDVLKFLTEDPSGKPTLDTALVDDANADLKKRLAAKTDLVGKDFKGGAAAEGTRQFTRLVQSVDFPRFVSGLIQNVYVAIVDASIKQMEEYGKLLAAVVKSVEQFAQENVTPGAARNFLMASFPGTMEMQSGDDGQQHLSLKDDIDDKDKPDFKTLLQMTEAIELTEENEMKIVYAAQLQMAREKQKQLAIMVAMGINRIIVTEGEIKANVMFDMKSKDTALRTTQASTYDSNSEVDTSTSGGGWFSDSGSSQVTTSVSSAYSAEQEKSTADLDVKAKLAGSVLVRFKSETFPIERLATGEQLGKVQSKGNVR
jgi:hypothetical protein